MSAPSLVVGKCYCDPSDGQIVRVLEREGSKTRFVVVPGPHDACAKAYEGTWDDETDGPFSEVWTTCVPDPTPAVVETSRDEMTLRELGARLFRPGVSLAVSCFDGKFGAAAMGLGLACRAEGRDLQDAVTNLLAKLEGNGVRS